MDKKYQVFVSSTYQDLIEERQKVIEALISKNCFPVGMEYFPAASEEQFTVIKKLIDRCDYYILILGGRYGSIEPKTGKSYTQLEYEYALNKNIPVAAFYHKNIGNLPSEKVENTDAGKKKYEEFKKLVQNNLCKSWGEVYELAFNVNITLDFMFENYPRIGWVKADAISSAEANKEILALKKENESLKFKLNTFSSNTPNGIESYCKGSDIYKIYYTNELEDLCDNNYENKYYSIEITWDDIFRSVCLDFRYGIRYDKIRHILSDRLVGEDCIITEECSNQICIQLSALKLIEFRDGFYTLSLYGYNEMIKLKALKK